MKKQRLADVVKRGLSTRQIGCQFGKSQSVVRYWLKKFGLETAPRHYRKNRSDDENRRCTLCGKVRDKKKDNYKAKCWACYVKIRRVRIQQAAFVYKGARCSRCGRSDGPQNAYDFHHTDGDKLFAISRAHCKSAKDIREELDKCKLLCAFCHRLEHAPDIEPGLMEAVAKRPIVF